MVRALLSVTQNKLNRTRFWGSRPVWFVHTFSVLPETRYKTDTVFGKGLRRINLVDKETRTDNKRGK